MKNILLFSTFFLCLSANSQKTKITIKTAAANYRSTALSEKFDQYEMVAIQQAFEASNDAFLLDLQFPTQLLSFRKAVNRIFKKPIVSVNNLPVSFSQDLAYFNSSPHDETSCRFMIGKNFISGKYILRGISYYIEPAYIYDSKAARNLLIIYSSDDIKKNEESFCGDTVNDEKTSLIKQTQSTLRSGCRTVDYTVLVDNSCFEYHNRNIDETVLAILTVMNLTEGDYSSSFNDAFKFEPYEIIIVDDPEHQIFEEQTTIQEQFSSFKSQTNIAYKHGYDVVYNWFYNGDWNGILGLANISSMCNTQASKVTLKDGGTLDGMRNLVSHETGHLFGCAHTAGCIMNVNINYSTCWHPTSVIEVNNFLSGSLDGCLTACEYDPCTDILPDVKSIIYDSIKNEITVTTNIDTGETYQVRWGPDASPSLSDSLLMAWPNTTVKFRPYCKETSNIQIVEIQRLCSSGISTSLKYSIFITPIHPTIQTSKDSICVGYDTDTLTASNVISGSVLRWRRNGEIVSGSSDSIFIADLPGDYKVDMATDESDKCWISSQEIQVFQKIPIQLGLTMSYSTKDYLKVDFRNYVYQGKEYELDFGDGSPIEKKIKPKNVVSHVYSKGGMYMPIAYGMGCDTVHSDTSFLYLTIDEFNNDSTIVAPSQHITLNRIDCRYSASFTEDSATSIHHIADEHFDRQRYMSEWVMKLDSGYYDNKVYPEIFWLAGNADSVHFQNDLAIRIDNAAKMIIFTITDQNNIQQDFIHPFPSYIDFHKWNSLAVSWDGRTTSYPYSYLRFNINKVYSYGFYLPSNINNYADSVISINGKKPTLSTGKHYAGSNLTAAGFYGTTDAIRLTNLTTQIDLTRDTLNFKPILTIENENLICSDSIIEISIADVFTPINREWYRNDTLIPNETTKTYTATESGSYYQNVTDRDGTTCKTDPFDLEAVTILSRWDYSKFGPTVSFKAYPLCYSEVKWNFGDGTNSTELNPVKKYSKTGNYTVSFIALNSFYQKADTLTQTIGIFDKIEDDFNNQSTLGSPENISFSEEYCNGQVQFRKIAHIDSVLSYIKYDSTSVPHAGTIELLVNLNKSYDLYDTITKSANLLYLKSSLSESSITILAEDNGWVAVRYKYYNGEERTYGFFSDFRYNQWNVISISYGNGLTLKVNNQAQTFYGDFRLDSPHAILGGKVTFHNGILNNFKMFIGDVEKIVFSYEENDFTYNTECILPVQIISFKADNNCPPTLTWQVTNEQNIKGYYIEQSIDGKHFYTISFLSASTGSSGVKNYQYKTPARNGLYYYRIRIQGNDGTTSYSKVISTQSNCSNVLSIIPNPASNNIKIQGLTKMVNDFSIINEAGMVLQSYTATPATQLNIASLPPGVYILKVNKTQTLKFFKMP